MKTFTKLSKLRPGDHVAVLSPSSGLPELFPWVQDLGLSRIKDELGLVPVEYPTTRQMSAPLQDRAQDIMDAFSNPDIKAIFASIGGSDQIKLIKYLDPSIFTRNPKPFFGFSDNTHLHNFLWNNGVPSYYGGSVMTQLAMQGSMHNMTLESIKRALFTEGEFEYTPSDTYNDEGLSWADKDNLQKTRKMEVNEGIFWDGDIDTEGTLWGGCVESLVAQVATNKYLPLDADLENTVLFLETAEDIPEPWIIKYLLTGFGERGWLEIFQAVLIGRPKAWEFNKQYTLEEKAAYRQAQRHTVAKVVREYNAHIPIVQNIDFGHTDPQVSLPMGNKVRLASSDKRLFFTY